MRKAVLAYVLKTPIPIVIIIRAKEFCTHSHICPNRAVEGHAHVVLAANPWGNLGLFGIAAVVIVGLQVGAER